MLNCNLFLWSKLYFQHHYFSLQCHMIFRNHNNMLICCSRNISDYYQCWKQLCCTIFLWKLMHFIFHDSQMNRKFKRTAFIWNRNLCARSDFELQAKKKKAWISRVFVCHRQRFRLESASGLRSSSPAAGEPQHTWRSAPRHGAGRSARQDQGESAGEYLTV